MYAIRSYYVYYQNLKNATEGTATVGGNNPSQRGYGVNVGTIDTMMSRSGFQTTGNGLDLAIAGRITSYNVCYTKLLRTNGKGNKIT